MSKTSRSKHRKKAKQPLNPPSRISGTQPPRGGEVVPPGSESGNSVARTASFEWTDPTILPGPLPGSASQAFSTVGQSRVPGGSFAESPTAMATALREPEPLKLERLETPEDRFPTIPSTEVPEWSSESDTYESLPPSSAKPVDAIRAPFAEEPEDLAESDEPPTSDPGESAPRTQPQALRAESDRVSSAPATLASHPPPSVPAPVSESSWSSPTSLLRPGIPSMHIVHVTSELAPVAKVGGLADVVFGLSRELEIRGNRVEIILPKYDCMRYDQIWGLSVCYQDLWVPWWGGHIHCTVWYGEVFGRRCFFIEPHSKDNFFNRGKFYGDNDDILRFAFFSRAALEFMFKTGRQPDIIHCHDWQTGILPVYLYEFYQQLGMSHPRVCYTIHNFRHQGVTGESFLTASDLGRPGHFLTPERLQDPRHPGAVNLMKGGIVYSNFVTTVSPNYAWEAKNNQGFGLERTLQIHQGKYGGVVNGVDYDVWNPEVDRHLPTCYSLRDIDRKYENKRALRNRFWLADGAKPIIAFIGRLDDQKGLELIQHAAWWATHNAAQFVLLGTAPDPRVGGQFLDLKRRLNDNPDCHIELSFDEDLSHLIYAGADMMLVPSRYEPCGLTQLIALRYGTVPVVRAIGGLADTVFDKDFDGRSLDQRNGFVFGHYDTHAIETTLARAVSCYYQFPDHFRAVMQNGMRCDYSWNHPGQHYLNIYDFIRNK